MNRIYLVDEDSRMTAYKTLSKAQEYAIIKYINWLKEQAERGNDIPVKTIVEDLESLYEYWTIEDFIYITEVPLYED